MITREEFLKAYDKYPPSKLQIWQHRYISKGTKQKDKWVSEVFTWTWVGMIAFGIICSAAQWMDLRVIITWTFVFTFVPFWIMLFISVQGKNLKLRKVMRELGINKREYKELADKYF